MNNPKIIISPSEFDRLCIERIPNGRYAITLEKDGEKTYFQGYNKVKDKYTTRSGFTACGLENIVAYAERKW